MTQRTCVALSENGLDFQANREFLGSFYWRVFQWNGYFYTVEMPGQLRRSVCGLMNFEEGPKLWDGQERHTAVRLRGNFLDVFFSRKEDCP